MRIVSIVPVLAAFAAGFATAADTADAPEPDCRTAADGDAFLDLSWVPPDSFENGAPLDVRDDLSGYEIYVETEDGEPRLVARASGQVTGCRLYLKAGPHQLSMRAVSDGVRSEHSNRVTKEARPAPARSRLIIEE